MDETLSTVIVIPNLIQIRKNMQMYLNYLKIMLIYAENPFKSY